MCCVSIIFFRLACRCAKESRAKGYDHFGLQYYGECWSDPGAADKFDRYGKSENCMGFAYKPCDDEDSNECVGGENKNYVYRVEEGEYDYHILRFLSIRGLQRIVLKSTATAAANEGSIHKKQVPYD